MSLLWAPLRSLTEKCPNQASVRMEARKHFVGSFGLNVPMFASWPAGWAFRWLRGSQGFSASDGN